MFTFLLQNLLFHFLDQWSIFKRKLNSCTFIKLHGTIPILRGTYRCCFCGICVGRIIYYMHLFNNQVFLYIWHVHRAYIATFALFSISSPSGNAYKTSYYFSQVMDSSVWQILPWYENYCLLVNRTLDFKPVFITCMIPLESRLRVM